MSANVYEVCLRRKEKHLGDNDDILFVKHDIVHKTTTTTTTTTTYNVTTTITNNNNNNTYYYYYWGR